MPTRHDVPGAGIFEVMDNMNYQIPADDGLARSTYIEDGDSVVFCGQQWRLLGYDAPETARHHGHCDQERERGHRAAIRLEELLCDAVEQDTLVWQITGKLDKYHRRCVYALIDGVNVGKILIAEELAHPYDGQGAKTPHCDCFSRAKKFDLEQHIQSVRADLKREMRSLAKS
jgi:endonuclease YncB( thermonuclease family)